MNNRTDKQPASRSSLQAFLAEQESRSLLRFITCGSVDDGKSTLIGRLLHDTQLLMEDQLARLTADSKRFGTRNGELDFALLVDGLAAEREQGITIDVAYRFFSTEKRKFVVADCPGHEQYTRNMATGASTVDLAVVLVDAGKGLLTQTRRHSYIVSLLGIRHVIVAINKMDLVDYDRETFDRLAEGYRALADSLGIENVYCVPVSALEGDNVIGASDNTPWYTGPSLLELLETIQIEPPEATDAARFPVQWVNRPDQNFRGFAGTLVAGTMRPGDEVSILPSGRRTRIRSILGTRSELEEAHAGQPVTLALTEEVDVSRGDVIVSARDPLEAADQFAVHLLWMTDEPLLPGRYYKLRLATRTVNAHIMEIKHKVDVNTQQELAARRLHLNEVGYCTLATDEDIAFAPFDQQPSLGSFILIDRQTNATIGAGIIDFALRRASNIHVQHIEVDKESRARIKGQMPRCLWFTGLSGSGKSTIANQVEKRLHARGYHSYILDGDNVRHGLNEDLGFTDADRVENIRRVAEVSKLMTDAGLIVLVSFISPFREERRMARELFDENEFFEVFIDTPLEVAEQRDTKGLYAKARAGKIPNFTGISSPYEPPENPEIHLQTVDTDPDELAERVIEILGLER